MSSRNETVEVPDGSFDLPLWLPEAGHGPGVLLVQEIWGVGEYIRSVAVDLAALGYVVAAPDLFWRLQPGWQAAHDEQGLGDSLKLASRFDFEQGVADAALALRQLAALPEVEGGVGVVGFCLGGSIGYFLAAQSEDAPAAAVSFYGSAIPGNLALLERIPGPLQLHFGGQDPYIPRENVARVEEAVAGRPNVEIHVQEDAGHAFHNRVAPMFHQPAAASRAWGLTENFLARHLPIAS